MPNVAIPQDHEMPMLMWCCGSHKGGPEVLADGRKGPHLLLQAEYSRIHHTCARPAIQQDPGRLSVDASVQEDQHVAGVLSKRDLHLADGSSSSDYHAIVPPFAGEVNCFTFYPGFVSGFASRIPE
jgi:hypothetical protein